MRIFLSLVICFSLFTACTKVTSKGGGAPEVSEAGQQESFERAVTTVQEDFRLEANEVIDVAPAE